MQIRCMRGTLRGALDEVDRTIVALLRENARRSFKDIGGHVHLTAPAVKRRVDRLERDGVIRGYTAAVDPRAFGWHAEAFVDLFCEGHMPGEAIKRAVEGEPGVVSAYTVAGEASAMLHVRARDTAHLEESLERLRDHPGVTRTQTQIVLSTLFERPVANSAGPAGADAGADENGRGVAAARDSSGSGATGRCLFD